MTIALSLTPTARKPGLLRLIAEFFVPGVAIIMVCEAVWIGMIAFYSKHPMPFPWFVPAMALFLGCGAAWMKWGSWPRLSIRPERS